MPAPESGAPEHTTDGPPSVFALKPAESLPPLPQQEPTTQDHTAPSAPAKEQAEVDDFGLPIRKAPVRSYTDHDEDHEEDHDHEDEQEQENEHENGSQPAPTSPVDTVASQAKQADSLQKHSDHNPAEGGISDHNNAAHLPLPPTSTEAASETRPEAPRTAADIVKEAATRDEAQNAVIASQSSPKISAPGASEWSHQPVSHPKVEKQDDYTDDDAWQEMPAYATHTIYDDWGKVIAREVAELDEEEAAYGHLGGAGKGYTRVQLDDDVQSATSMDEDTAYLFKSAAAENSLAEDDDGRDILSQMQATKDLLTEGQRIAYVGVVRLSMIKMIREMEAMEKTKNTRKFVETATEAMQMWSQKMMVRLYSHMEIDPAEQIMIEQLAAHGVEPADLTPTLMQNARVKNPGASEKDAAPTTTTTSNAESESASPRESIAKSEMSSGSAPSSIPPTPTMPPPYEADNPPDYLTVTNPNQLPDSKNIDIDLRWTVLCDLFLVLIADSIYDARSRTLLELVGSALAVPWLDICRFEKRVTDALEMQEAADKENWNEEQHLEQRKKSSRNRRLVMMGLATVGGGLVIGLSAGLLAPVIGAGLAAGFTTIGVAGTSSFLAGAGGAAIITSTGVLTGGTIAVRASNRRTGNVKTFEYRPLHNNKRVNLIVTVAGWMTGKVDDVRLPFSTVNPIMGDIYSIHWEPEMLTSMGDTINILATEALTQGLQQILGSTVLIALMSAMQLPLVLTKLSYLIDNPWAVSLARADLAGLVLADSLIDRNLGVRPVTLVGFSIGARLIHSCLKELAKRGAVGLVQNVYVFGTPLVVKKDEYLRAKTVVSGRFVNGYATNDWILGYLFRATSGGIMRIAGLAPVEIPGVENYNVTELVPGHMAYRKSMPRLMREVGWIVESDEFSEIEDPDPDNHEERQRELINEIEEARRDLGKKPEKKGLKALFGRSKKNAERKEWETYDERLKAGGKTHPDGAEGPEGIANGVLFDVDAIRQEAAELAAQGIEIKEIKGTMPPMKLDVSGERSPSTPPDWSGAGTGSALRQTQSLGTLPARPSSVAQTRSFNGAYDYDEVANSHSHAESNISLTFEGPDENSRNITPRGLGLTSPPPSQSPFTSGSANDSRPQLLSARTMPVMASSPLAGAAMSHAEFENAWASEDEEFGGEKEVQMTFE